MSWLDDNRDVLAHRAEAFAVIDKELRQYRSPHIVETGGLRGVGNVSGDGNSTLLFDDIAKATSGRVVSIDIDRVCADNVAKHCSSRTVAVTGNSLVELPKLWNLTVNCLYLDSLDVNFEDDEPAASHAFHEFLLSRKMLSRDALVCVDDNDALGRGKGRMLSTYAMLMRWECLSGGYVKVWRTNGYL